jgi:hypothetical protein
MISTGMYFEGNFGPSNQELVSWASCELAEYLFQQETYQEAKLNEKLQDVIQIDSTMQLPLETAIQPSLTPSTSHGLGTNATSKCTSTILDPPRLTAPMTAQIIRKPGKW